MSTTEDRKALVARLRRHIETENDYASAFTAKSYVVPTVKALEAFDRLASLPPEQPVAPTLTPSGKYDFVLRPFLALMDFELHANAGKGDRPGWLGMDRSTVLLEVYYHLAKLQKAVRQDERAAIQEYAADVANMAMMVVDVCGCLAVEDSSPTPAAEQAAQPSEPAPTQAEPVRRWPFVETPGEFAERLRATLHEFGELLPAVRYVLIEEPAALASAHPAREAQPLTDEHIDGLRGLDTASRVRFYEHDFYVLSNFSAFTLYWDGLRFDTSEAAYHYEKFPDWPEIRAYIKNAPSAHEAFKHAESNKIARRPDWDDVKVGIMRNILRAKAAQHEYVRRKLLATGDRELVEDSWRDDFWGWGPDRNGRNLLGKLWMEIRAELRAPLSITQEQKE
jgi:ribA/ribD-fused uncharacterized protein